MVIQRIQTLYLLLAILMVVVFLFVPFGYLKVLGIGVKSLRACEIAQTMIPAGVSLLLMVLSIVMFKEFKLQKALVLLSILSVALLIGIVVYALLHSYVGIKPTWGGGGIMLLGALVALIAAYGRICADHKLLRSYDRLR